MARTTNAMAKPAASTSKPKKKPVASKPKPKPASAHKKLTNKGPAKQANMDAAFVLTSIFTEVGRGCCGCNDVSVKEIGIFMEWPDLVSAAKEIMDKQGEDLHPDFAHVDEDDFEGIEISKKVPKSAPKIHIGHRLFSYKTGDEAYDIMRFELQARRVEVNPSNNPFVLDAMNLNNPCLSYR
jgi:hypothetical protein